jgi:hypothetical protein
MVYAAAYNASMPVDNPTFGSVCLSCGSTRTARFCADCGERLLTTHDFNLSHFLLHELPHETFHVDGKLPRTLKLLFARPGFLPGEYVRGRRLPYVNPLRLYLLVFIVFALVSAMTPYSKLSLPERAAQMDPTGWVSHLATERTTVRWDDPSTRERVAAHGHWLSEGGTLVIFLGVAFVQWGVFWRWRRRYLEHAILGLSVATFCLLAVLLYDLAWILASTLAPTLADATGGGAMGNGFAIGITAAVLLTYWFIAIRRFYGAPVLGAAAATIVITIAQVIIAEVLNILELALLVVTT